MSEHLVDCVVAKFDIPLLESLRVDWFDHGNHLLLRGLESVVLLEGFAIAVVGAIASRYLGHNEAG